MERGLRVRKDGSRWGNVPSWSDAQRTVYNTRDGERGTILSVDAIAQTVTIQWADGDFPVVYPSDAEVLRRTPYPWEV